jgi:hypothetical protein
MKPKDADEHRSAERRWHVSISKPSEFALSYAFFLFDPRVVGAYLKYQGMFSTEMRSFPFISSLVLSRAARWACRK